VGKSELNKVPEVNGRFCKRVRKRVRTFVLGAHLFNVIRGTDPQTVEDEQNCSGQEARSGSATRPTGRP
jgi:hypothetical protein